MSLEETSNSISYSHSPILRKTKRVSLQNTSGNYNKTLSESFSSKKILYANPRQSITNFSNHIIKPGKFPKNLKFIPKPKNNSMSNINLKSNLKYSIKKYPCTKKSEVSFAEDLKKENDLFKKIEIIISTIEKLFALDKNFVIFYKVLIEFLIEIKTHYEPKKTFICEDLEKTHKDLKSNYEKLLVDYQNLQNENSLLKHEIDRTLEESSSLKVKNRRYINFLKQLHNKGVPIEEFYEEIFKPCKNSKNKLNIETKDTQEEKRSSSIPLHLPKTIPKINFSNNLSGDFQDEFMSKFNEFSESWRKQIINDHKLINK